MDSACLLECFTEPTVQEEMMHTQIQSLLLYLVYPGYLTGSRDGKAESQKVHFREKVKITVKIALFLLQSCYGDRKKTRNLEAYVEWFNRLSYLVATEICMVSKDFIC